MAQKKGTQSKKISRSSRHGEPSHLCDVTPAMVEAGVAVLVDLQGEVSRVYLVKEVYLAMRQACSHASSPQSKCRD